MAKVLKHSQLSKDFFLIELEQKNTATVGQFYMLRAWKDFPVLSRPISIYDATPDTLTFLYKTVGKGTEIFSKLKVGDDMTADGPYGNGFPDVTGRIAMVGGGVGIAPLYYAAKEIKKKHPETEIDIYLGFNDEEILRDEFTEVCDSLIIDVGGFVTEFVDTTKYDSILTCGPTIMMRVLYERWKTQESEAKLFVSMENRMACGIGTCLGCSCHTIKGNKRVCKDGPVFLGEEVFADVEA